MEGERARVSVGRLVSASRTMAAFAIGIEEKVFFKNANRSGTLVMRDATSRFSIECNVYWVGSDGVAAFAGRVYWSLFALRPV